MILPSTPFRVEFEVTGACNLRCRYCLAMPFTGYTPPLSRLLELFLRTRDELKPFEVVVTGGEPFVRPDIIDLLDKATDIFGSVGITTNGTLLGRLSEDSLQRLRLISGKRGTLQVSIDSIEGETNDILRGATGDVLEGFEVLERSEILFTVGIVITRVNAPKMETTLAHLLRSYRYLRGISLMNLMPSEILGRDFFSLNATRSEYLRACSSAAELRDLLGREDVSIFTDAENQEAATMIDALKIPHWFAGLTKLEVLASGDVVGCAMIRGVVVGNVYRESWDAILQRSSARFQNLKREGFVGPLCLQYNIVNKVASGNPANSNQV